MAPKNVAYGQSSNTKSSLMKIQILVVDDDLTSLTVVSAMLKMSSCQERMVELTVVTVNSPLDALATLRMQRNAFDLVLTDLHMPKMNGMELQKHVDAEFKLPVIIMSSDDKESVILESLKAGALSYVVKPVSPDDLRNIWQHAVAAKREKSTAVIKEIGSGANVEMPSPVERLASDGNKNASVPSGSKEKSTATDSKKKGRKRGRGDQEDANTSAAKKAKVVWNNSLHNRFLQAVSHIGLDKAVPKKILEFMNVPGLTRENVASHLQKYRLFLKKVAEKGISSSKNLSERALKSAFRSGIQSPHLRNNRQDYAQFPGLEQVKASLLGIGASLPSLGNSSYTPRPILPSHDVSGGKSVPSFDALSSFQRPIFGNTASPHFGTIGNNNAETNSLFSGGMSFGLVNATASPMQVCQEQNPAPSSDFNKAVFTFGAGGSQVPNYVSGLGMMGSINNPGPSLNYGGAKMTGDGGQLAGTGQMLSGYSNGGGFNPNVSTAFGNGNFNSLSFGAGPSSAAPALDCVNKFSTIFTNNVSQDPALPTLSQPSLGRGGENNDPVFNSISAAASAFNSKPNDQQQNIGDVDFDKFAVDPFIVPTPLQQQGGDGTVNFDFTNFEMDNNMNNFASSFHAVENPALTEQRLNQLSIGGEKDPNFGGNMSEYYPSFEQLLEGGDRLADLGVKDAHSLDNIPTGEQNWGDEFLDSLLVENEGW